MPSKPLPAHARRVEAQSISPDADSRPSEEADRLREMAAPVCTGCQSTISRSNEGDGPRCVWCVAGESSERGGGLALAQQRTRFMDRDHDEALRLNYAFDVYRDDPDGMERERRAQRQDDRQREWDAWKR